MSTRDAAERPPVSLAGTQNLIRDFAEDLAAQGKAPASIEGYVAQVRVFEGWLGRDMRSAGRDDFRKYMVYMRAGNLAYSTLRFSMSAISTFYIFLEDERLVEFNQVPGVVRKYITIEQASLLINSILPARDKAIAVMLAKTGLRVGELATLELQDVDVESLTLFVHPHPKRTNCTVFFRLGSSRLP